MLFEVLMQYSCIISHQLSSLEQRLCDIQVVITRNFVDVSSFSVKRTDCKYTSRTSLGSAIYQCLQQIPKEDYLSAFRDWVKKAHKKCVSVKGEYFEGL